MSIKGSRAMPTQRRRKLIVYEKGRTCDFDGCDSILSKYNKDKTCFAHSRRNGLYKRISP